MRKTFALIAAIITGGLGIAIVGSSQAAQAVSGTN